MNLKTALSLVKGGRLRLLWNATSLFTPFYRISFVASAVSSGLLELLADSPKSLDQLAVALAPDGQSRPGLEAWLGLGVRLGELAKGPDGYRLAGYLSRKLADKANDEVAALVEEVASFHHRLILETPARLKRRELWRVEEHDGCLIARSSRIMEPCVFQLIEQAMPPSGAVRLLEVGCGSGSYIRHAAQRNPELRAVGLEMQPEVADATRKQVASWGMQDRITIDTGDIRARPADPSFDIVTLYNAIYYFRSEERVAVFEKLASFLKPGGRLILSTSCQGGSAGMQLLNVWTSSVVGFGPLPTEAELVEQLGRAGFRDLSLRRVIPGEAYLAIVATVDPGARA